MSRTKELCFGILRQVQAIGMTEKALQWSQLDYCVLDYWCVLDLVQLRPMPMVMPWKDRMVRPQLLLRPKMKERKEKKGRSLR